MFISAPTPSDSEKLLAGMVALATPFLAISYFALTWATNRVKDWEASKTSRKVGAPAQIVWLAGGGIVINCGLGTFLFGLLYIAQADASRWYQYLAVGGILFTFYLILRILVSYTVWYYRAKVPIRTTTAADIAKLYNPHRLLRFDIWLFYSCCPIFFIDLFSGSTACGVCGILYGVFATFGIGAYCGIIGDLLPRSCTIESGDEGA